MIEYRCWYCNKNYLVSESRIGERKRCTCSRWIKVPRYSGGSSRSRKFWEFVIEGTVYGGGLAIFCMMLAVLLGRRAFGLSPAYFWFIGGCGMFGFLAGLFGGERVIDWVGRRIRNWEEDRRYGP